MVEMAVLALLVATVFLALWRWRSGRPWLVLAIFWLAYAVYEWLMAVRVFCSGECNIRVDLLLIAPLLLGRTLWVLVSEARWAVQRRRGHHRDASHL